MCISGLSNHWEHPCLYENNFSCNRILLVVEDLIADFLFLPNLQFEENFKNALQIPKKSKLKFPIMLGSSEGKFYHLPC